MKIENTTPEYAKNNGTCHMTIELDSSSVSVATYASRANYDADWIIRVGDDTPHSLPCDTTREDIRAKMVTLTRLALLASLAELA